MTSYSSMKWLAFAGLCLLASCLAYASDPCAGDTAYCSDSTGFHAYPGYDSCNYYSDSTGFHASPYCSKPDPRDEDRNPCAGQTAYCSDSTGFHAFPDADTCSYYSDSSGFHASAYCSK